MATIKEIADSLGVSTATVSNVIHGNLHKMSPETAERIRAKLVEYDYIPNMGARMLALGNSQIIGVATNYPNRVDKIALTDPFVSEVIGAIEAEIRQQRYFMMFYAAQTATEINQIAQRWNTQGLIILGLLEDQCRELIQASTRPVVFIDAFFRAEESYNNIGLEDRKGGYLLGRHLVQNGHRHVLFLSDADYPHSVDGQRYQGCLDALAEAGLSADHLDYFCVGTEYAERKRGYQTLLPRIGKPYTAFMFSSDFYAVEAMGFFSDQGIRVPQDISVTGFDGNMLSRFVRPRLTTIRQPTAAKGIRAVQLLLQAIAEPDMPTSNVVLPVEFLPGQTVRNLLDRPDL